MSRELLGVRKVSKGRVGLLEKGYGCHSLASACCIPAKD